MDDETTFSLYAQIKELAKQFAGKYEVGIAVEITALFENMEEIQEFHKSWDHEGYFVISLSLKHFDRWKAKDIFTRLVRFLEYGDATLYTREIEENAIRYILASLTKDGLRFACKVDFLQYVEQE